MTLSRVPESLVNFGCQLVARGRGRGGQSRRRWRRARAVHSTRESRKLGAAEPPSSRGGGVGRCSESDM